MVITRSFSCLLIVALFSLSRAFPAEGSEPLSALPPDGFSFTGNWDCAGSFRNNKVHKSTYTGAVVLAGKWLELTEEDIEPATGYRAIYLIGYDPQQKGLVEFDANSFAAAMYTSAEGWQNHVLTMTSPILDDPKAPYAANRFLYSTTGVDTFTVDWQVSKTSALAWVTADHLACKRQAHG